MVVKEGRTVGWSLEDGLIYYWTELKIRNLKNCKWQRFLIEDESVQTWEFMVSNEDNVSKILEIWRL